MLWYFNLVKWLLLYMWFWMSQCFLLSNTHNKCFDIQSRYSSARPCMCSFSWPVQRPQATWWVNFLHLLLICHHPLVDKKKYLKLILYAYYDVIDIWMHEASPSGKVGISLMEESLVNGPDQSYICKSIMHGQVLILFQPSYDHKHMFKEHMSLLCVSCMKFPTNWFVKNFYNITYIYIYIYIYIKAEF
jgi:hypothetical protein